MEISPIIWRVAEHVSYKEQGNTIDCVVHTLLNICGVINEHLAIESIENIQTLRYWIAAKVLNLKDESIFIYKEVLDNSVVSNTKNILMSKTEGMELKRLQHENKKQKFAEIYGIIDIRKYILEQQMISHVDVESDDTESVKSVKQIFFYRW